MLKYSALPIKMIELVKRNVELCGINKYCSFIKVDAMREITIKELATKVSQKKAEFGYSGDGFVQPNSGRLRTESKRALLRNIARGCRTR